MLGNAYRLLAGCSECSGVVQRTLTELRAGEEARKHLTLAHQMQSESLGDDHPDTVESKESLEFLDAGCCETSHAELGANGAAAGLLAEDAVAK